jgi:hypothetical protein
LSAQAPVAAQALQGPMMARPVPFNPAADYITAGQDEPGYRSWYLAAPWRAAQVKSFNTYLNAYQVGGVFPTWQLLRTATSWQECGGQPFELPPAEEWPHIVQTLRYIQDYVIPAVGPVEPVSGYRNPSLNQCAGGAPESAHKHYSAIDMVPLRPITRIAMMRTLCAVHSQHGPQYNAGLHAVPHRQHQVPPLEHGSGGRRRMSADHSHRGYRQRRPATSRDVRHSANNGRSASRSSANSSNGRSPHARARFRALNSALVLP